MIHVQEDLVTLASERRLIPFVGAGFSAALGLPSWETMLREVSKITQSPIDFDQVMASTNNDLLQVAEYYFLQHDRQIGPIRREIERAFSSPRPNPLSSNAHIELANLGAGQIYTTNYDDILEQTQRDLGLPFKPVILPKDVAMADPDTTQVVKYHGDLAHERTLVLTESAYYKRLDFESPMDLKFRSDLLGKSVLFMGYSFRDVNVRIIWFKLMDMMRDIPEADRRPSYIVRFEPDAALEKLYLAVGLRTIVLNPGGGDTSPAEKAKLLADFLLTLSLQAGTAVRRPLADGTHESVTFVSGALLQEVRDRMQRLPARLTPTGARRYGSYALGGALFDRLYKAEVPPILQGEWERTLEQALPVERYGADISRALARVRNREIVGRYVLGILAQAGSQDARLEKELLLRDPTLDWESIWQTKLSPSDVAELLELLASEIQYQARRAADEDIVYLAVLGAWVAEGKLLDGKGTFPEGATAETMRDSARQLLEEAAKIYPVAASVECDPQRPPMTEALAAQVERRGAVPFKPVEIDLFRVMSLGDPERSREAARMNGARVTVRRTGRGTPGSPSNAH